MPGAQPNYRKQKNPVLMTFQSISGKESKLCDDASSFFKIPTSDWSQNK